NLLAGRVDPSRPGWVELAGIGPVRVAKQATLAAGDVDLMIRPERLRLRAPGEIDGADNAVDLVVDDIINYGDSILVIGKTRGLPLRARLVGGNPERLRPGAALPLAWAPADAHVLARRQDGVRSHREAETGMALRFDRRPRRFLRP